jgi:hypothetical protein
MRNEQIQPIVEKTIRYDRMRKNKFRIKLRLWNSRLCIGPYNKSKNGPLLSMEDNYSWISCICDRSQWDNAHSFQTCVKLLQGYWGNGIGRSQAINTLRNANDAHTTLTHGPNDLHYKVESLILQIQSTVSCVVTGMDELDEHKCHTHWPHPGHQTKTPLTGSWHKKQSPILLLQLLHTLWAESRGAPSWIVVLPKSGFPHLGHDSWIVVDCWLSAPITGSEQLRIRLAAWVKRHICCSKSMYVRYHSRMSAI